MLVWTLNDRLDLGESGHRDFCEDLENILQDRFNNLSYEWVCHVRPTRSGEIEGLRLNVEGLDLEFPIERAADHLGTNGESDLGAAYALHGALRDAWETAVRRIGATEAQ